MIERRIADACNAIGYHYARKFGAIRERRRADACDTVGNNNVYYTAAHAVDFVVVTVNITRQGYSFFTAGVGYKAIVASVIVKEKSLIGKYILVSVILIAYGAVVYKNLCIISYVAVICTSYFKE